MCKAAVQGLGLRKHFLNLFILAGDYYLSVDMNIYIYICIRNIHILYAHTYTVTYSFINIGTMTMAMWLLTKILNVYLVLS